MTRKRIEEIQEQTAYPESMSVHEALMQVWTELHQDFNSRTCENCKWYQTHTYQSAMKTKETETTLTRCMKYHINWGKDFGCNKWEKKDD